MTDSVVEFRDVTKSFGEVVAVDHVSLQIERHEFISFLGPSGCGKSTTLRLIAGFETPNSGEIYIDGQYMGKKPPFQRDKNTVFQDYALFPHMNVFDNIAFGLRMKKVNRDEIKKRVSGVLELVRLPGLESRHPGQLSGGQQQRVALARALVNEPAVLLLDEPLGSLDLKLRKQMQIELKKIQKKVGITFVYVTHDQEEALVMSDRIAVMDRGRIAQIGKPDQIYRSPSSMFTADFIGETNLLQGKVVNANQDLSTLEVDGIEITATTVGDINKGEAAYVSIRPEDVFFVEDTTEKLDNIFNAEIVDRIFRGPSMRYWTRLENGATITKDQNATLTQHEIGDLVRIGWKRGRSVLVKK